MKNIRKRRILAWILTAVLMITQCPSNVFADVIPTESSTEQQVAPAEEPESTEGVNEETPVESSGESEAGEPVNSEPEAAVQEGAPADSEQADAANDAPAESQKEAAEASKDTVAASADSSKVSAANAAGSTDSGKKSAAKAPAAKAAAAEDDTEEEEGGEAPLVGAPPVALNSMTSSLTVGANPSTNVGRGDSISLAIAFALYDDQIPTARDAEYWTYDLSSV
ncbi:MAG: hypothetical protein J6D53_04865, partial [Blautia sp.]|nr:hypothetical protein [Blautia sp.]